MSYVDCPYCDHEVEINHDDGYGYEENEIYTQECKYCGKTFAYTTVISYDHSASQAPCQNGEEHDFRPIKGCPKEYFVGRKRCSWCGEEIVDVEMNSEAMKKYFAELESSQ